MRSASKRIDGITPDRRPPSGVLRPLSAKCDVVRCRQPRAHYALGRRACDTRESLASLSPSRPNQPNRQRRPPRQRRPRRQSGISLAATGRRDWITMDFCVILLFSVCFEPISLACLVTLDSFLSLTLLESLAILPGFTGLVRSVRQALPVLSGRRRGAALFDNPALRGLGGPQPSQCRTVA